MNKIIIIDDTSSEQKEVRQIPGLNIVFQGGGNIVEVSSLTRFQDCAMIMHSNCHVRIGATKHKISKLKVFCNSRNKVIIGKNFSCLGADCRLQENEVGLQIGNNCMFSTGIVIYASDGHAIYEIATPSKSINKGSTIRIGDHVWVGRHVTLLKKTVIGNDCIIGFGSLVTKVFNINNAIIGGYPARVLKTNVNWDRKPPQEFDIFNLRKKNEGVH